MRWVCLAIYAACVVAANWMIRHVGTAIPGGTHLVPVGFGLMAPSGVYAAALTLVCRDVVQRVAGRRWGLAVIPFGVAVTALWDVRLALASGTAFLLSELLDYLVYSRLQERSLTLAVLVSASAGNVVDSATFLLLAGIPLAVAFPGLVLGKMWAILAATVFIGSVSSRIPRTT